MIDVSTQLRRFWMTLCAVALVAAASGCATLRMGYDSLPTLLSWQMDKYWSLDSNQKTLARERIEAIQGWHRQNELKQYAKFLDGVRDRVRAPVDAGEVSRWKDAAEHRWMALAQRAAPDLADLAMTLRPEQVQRMKRKLVETNAEFRKDHFPNDPSERAAKRIESLEKRADYFFGSVNDAQREAIRRHVQTAVVQDNTMMAERMARQQRFVAAVERIVEGKASRPEAQKLMADAMAGVWNADPRRADAAHRLESANEELVATLVNLASDGQKSKLLKRLAALGGDFQQLAMR